MKVSELIEMLKAVDGDAEVLAETGDSTVPSYYPAERLCVHAHEIEYINGEFVYGLTKVNLE